MDVEGKKKDEGEEGNVHLGKEIFHGCRCHDDKKTGILQCYSFYYHRAASIASLLLHFRVARPRALLVADKPYENRPTIVETRLRWFPKVAGFPRLAPRKPVTPCTWTPVSRLRRVRTEMEQHGPAE